MNQGTRSENSAPAIYCYLRNTETQKDSCDFNAFIRTALVSDPLHKMARIKKLNNPPVVTLSTSA
ncbi:MAG: hypothetical protein V3V10_09745, partial [Planctomycetota bacterium]